MFLICVFYLTCVYASVVESKCVTTFRTTCENLEDILNSGTSDWTNLLIQGDQNPTSTLARRTFTNLPNLRELYIIGQVSEITPGVFDALSNLHYLQFYKNLLKNLRAKTFSGFTDLKSLDLSENAIEDVDVGILGNSVIAHISLSNNKLKTLRAGCLNIPSLKRLDLRKNSIVQLEPGCFNENLETLDLSENNLKSIDARVLSKLDNMKSLNLSHNRLDYIYKVPKIPHLNTLDLSHNEIGLISEEAFADFPELKHLHLGNNKLTELYGNTFHMQSKVTNLYLHMNYLTSFFYNVGERLHNLKEITLGGNPWVCSCLLDVRRYIDSYHVTSPRCDVDFFNNGDSPVCVTVDVASCNGSQIFGTEQDVFEFRKSIVKYDCV